jgi:hypothetical protein
MIGAFGRESKVDGGALMAVRPDAGSNPAQPDPADGTGPQGKSGKDQKPKSMLAKIVGSPWFSGIVSGVISGAIVTFAITATGHSTGVRLLQMVRLAKPPTCTNPGWLMQVPDDQILANSWYAARDNLQYYQTVHTPDLTVDGNVRTAWLQWWPTGGLSTNTSSGNYITWSFAQSYDVRLVCILNGWEEDSTTFNYVEPIERATIGNSAPGCSGPSVKLKVHSYSYTWNPVQLPHSHSTRLLCLQISSVYRLKKTPTNCAPGPPKHMYPCRMLTGLSEVRFYYSPMPLDRVPF